MTNALGNWISRTGGNVADRAAASPHRQWVITLFAATALASIAAGIIATTGLDPVNSFFFQILLFFISLMAAEASTRRSARDNAQDLIRADAVKALRRITTTYALLEQLRREISVSHTGLIERSDNANAVLAAEIYGHIRLIDVQLRMAADSLDDWKDIAPDVVAEIEKASEQVETFLKGERS